MPKLTFIGRVSDGMLLCETYEDLHRESFELKNLAKNVLKKLSRAPDTCILDTQLSHTFYYKIVEGVAFLTCTESKFPKKLAFSYLDELVAAFQEELKKKWGTGESVDIRSKIETIERPYAFINFDRITRKIRQNYLSPTQDMADIHGVLEDVKHIMRENIDTILERDKKISEIGDMASRLKTDSKVFEGKARHLNFSMWLRKYGFFIAIAAIVVFGLYFRFA